MDRREIGSRGATVAIMLAVVLSGAGAALAHEGHAHQVKGTVKTVDEARLVVETTTGKRNLYLLTEKTKYRRGSEKATREEIAVGERVVVSYEVKEGSEWALEVRVGAKSP